MHRTPARANIPIGSGWKRDPLKTGANVQEPRGRTSLGSAAVDLANAGR